MKRFLAVFILITAMLTATMLTMPAFAETVTQDGLEITLTTDKDIYDVGEAINAQLSVRNTTDVPIRNIRTKISEPNGYALVNQNEMTIDELLSNTARVLSSDFVNASTEAPIIPQTGDDASIGLWIGLMITSVAVLCVLSAK